MVNNDKLILDATAGFRMMWFDKHHPNAVYLDQRPECEPDIIGDFRDLKQFSDETFKLIVFDPPHLIKPKSQNLVGIIATFGSLEPETWQADLKKGFQELWRILQPYGILLIKWNNHQVSSADFLKLFPEKPLIYQVSSSRNRREFSNNPGSSGQRNIQTLWFCFMKIPKEVDGK